MEAARHGEAPAAALEKQERPYLSSLFFFSLLGALRVIFVFSLLFLRNWQQQQQ